MHISRVLSPHRSFLNSDFSVSLARPSCCAWAPPSMDHIFFHSHRMCLQIKSQSHHRVSSFVFLLSAVRSPILPLVPCLKRIVPYILSSFVVFCYRSESLYQLFNDLRWKTFSHSLGSLAHSY